MEDTVRTKDMQQRFCKIKMWRINWAALYGVSIRHLVIYTLLTALLTALPLTTMQPSWRTTAPLSPQVKPVKKEGKEEGREMDKNRVRILASGTEPLHIIFGNSICKLEIGCRWREIRGGGWNWLSVTAVYRMSLVMVTMSRGKQVQNYALQQIHCNQIPKYQFLNAWKHLYFSEPFVAIL